MSVAHFREKSPRFGKDEVNAQRSALAVRKHLGTAQTPDSPNANTADVTASTFCLLSPSKLPFVGVERLGDAYYDPEKKK